MIFRKTMIEGLHEVVLQRQCDERGSFARSFCEREFAAAGLPSRFMQTNVSVNRSVGTLRGMHFQTGNAREGKLVRCVRGGVHDSVTDLRTGSATYLRSLSFRLEADGELCLYIPPGCAHGFQTLRDDTEVLYQMTCEYEPALASGFRYDDPAASLTWPLPVSVISSRDLEWPPLRLPG